MIFVYSTGILWYYIKANVYGKRQGESLSHGQAAMRAKAAEEVNKRRTGNQIEESKLDIAGSGPGGICHRQVYRHLF